MLLHSTQQRGALLRFPASTKPANQLHAPAQAFRELSLVHKPAVPCCRAAHRRPSPTSAWPLPLSPHHHSTAQLSQGKRQLRPFIPEKGLPRRGIPPKKGQHLTLEKPPGTKKTVADQPLTAQQAALWPPQSPRRPPPRIWTTPPVSQLLRTTARCTWATWTARSRRRSCSKYSRR